MTDNTDTQDRVNVAIVNRKHKLLHDNSENLLLYKLNLSVVG